MTKLVNSLEKGLARKKEAVDTDELKQNIVNAISSATTNLINKFNDDEISLDVKDIKDLTAVYTMLSNEVVDNKASGTPAISSKLSSFYDSKLQTNKNVIDISEHLATLNDEEINRLAGERDTIINDENSKKADG